MYFKYAPLSALAAITFLTQAPASLAASHGRHQHRARAVQQNDLDVLDRRAMDDGTVQIQMNQLQMLQSEITAFQGWMDTYINTTSSMDQETALAQLKQEFESFNGWMTAFLNGIQGNGPTSLPALPTTKPLVAHPSSSVIDDFKHATSTAQPSYTSLAAQLAHPSSTTDSEPSITTSTSTAPTSATSAATSSVVAPEDLNKPSVTPVRSSSSTHASSTQASVSQAPSAAAPSGGSSTGSGGSFNAKSDSNVAVYYGQSGATSQVTLAQMCQDSNVDIVILAFVNTFFGAGGYPTLNLGAGCSGTSPAQTAKGATGLLSCPTMAQDIKTCQGLGKKVMMSLGGAVGTSAFSGTQQADQFATKLWDLFGGGNGESTSMRPFGDAKVDGFDLDNEDHSTLYYSDFVSALRKTYSSDSSKTYYISAAPQCPRPDASIPLDAMQTMDFVFVQFYNNGPCNVGQSGFVDSFKAWSSDLAAKGAGPKLYVGAPGCTACAGSGYQAPAQMGTVISSAKTAGVSNFGGVMLWDGPEAKENTDGGKDYLSVVKSALA